MARNAPSTPLLGSASRRLAVAGGAVGLERSYHGRTAGLRTYLLVSFGSAILVAGGPHEFLAHPNESGEVTRIIRTPPTQARKRIRTFAGAHFLVGRP